jgi:NAD(P)-dependent dehydrogenase (short-subunit alcohol dehydrogenase family)
VAETRTAVVTGGSRGIGRAVVERLATDGYHVVAVGRDRGALDAVAAWADHAGLAVATRVCDVTDEDAVAGLFDTPVDVLVTSAGVSASAPLHRTSLADWHRQLDVNATGVFLAMRAALSAMRERDHGRIVVVASVAGLVGAPYIAAYTASKHAAVGLVRAAAAEVAGTGITVNAVCPAYVDTDMTDQTIARIVELTGRSVEEARTSLERMQPLGRLVTPVEVADAVAYLCGEHAAAVNGQTIVLDGGGVQT